MAPVPDYVFTRDRMDNNRFNLQHYLWVELFGYLVHPTIPLRGCSEIKIADIGTGTGIWLTDLSATLPTSVQLDGLDISFDATPPRPFLPSNLTLRVWDIRAPLEKDLVGAYDIVHICNFAFVLLDDEIPVIVTKLVEMLKPGGYIQWGEADVATFRIEKASSEVKTDSLRELLQLSQPRDARLNPTWVSGLSGIFAVAGLEVVEIDVKDASPNLGWSTHQCNLPVHELIARRRRDLAALRSLKDLMPQAIAETNAGAYWAFTRQIVVGRKVGQRHSCELTTETAPQRD